MRTELKYVPREEDVKWEAPATWNLGSVAANAGTDFATNREKLDVIRVVVNEMFGFTDPDLTPDIYNCLVYIDSVCDIPLSAKHAARSSRRMSAATRYIEGAFDSPDARVAEARAVAAIDTELAAVKIRHILSSGYGCDRCFENDLRDAVELPLVDCNHGHI